MACDGFMRSKGSKTETARRLVELLILDRYLLILPLPPLLLLFTHNENGEVIELWGGDAYLYSTGIDFWFHFVCLFVFCGSQLLSERVNQKLISFFFGSLDSEIS